ncbi:MAG: FAD-dependent monooxygenase [Sulfuriferula sp.]
MREHSDIVIVGGGPVGTTLALLLADSDFSIQLLEARADLTRPAHRRTLALSYGSRLILERLGVWSNLNEITPITTIHISQRNGLGMAWLRAAEEKLPALGYVLDYAELDAALHARLRASSVSVVTGARVDEVRAASGYATMKVNRDSDVIPVTARLAVVADGGAGTAQRVSRDYDQHALIAAVTTELAHNGCAYERFTPDGPVALLPQGDGFALVWTASPAHVQALLALPDAQFLDALHGHFGDRAGRFLSVAQRASFPLGLRYAAQTTRPHTVMIGNAAQMLHPVAGQGFNLGLRDAWELATRIRTSQRDLLGSTAMLADYSSARRLDTRGGIFFTDLLVRVFSNDHWLLHHGRSIGLAALQMLPPVKRFVARRMIFGARG